MPPFVEGYRFEIPKVPIFTIEDPLHGELSHFLFFSFFRDPGLDFSDWATQANLFFAPRVSFGLGTTAIDSQADLISRNSCPLVSIAHPVVKRCIKALPRVFKCCSYQNLDIRFCRSLNCAEEINDFIYEVNLNHLHIGCKACQRAAQIKFQDKDFSFTAIPDDTITLEGAAAPGARAPALDKPWR